MARQEQGVWGGLAQPCRLIVDLRPPGGEGTEV